METCTRAISPSTQLGPDRAGFTLAESLMASVFLAASVIGIAGMLSASYQQTAVRGQMATAMGLASQLMEEIASRPLDLATGQTNQPGWPSGQTNRVQYDTIDDFNGYSDVSGSIQTSNGTTLDLGDGGSYTRSVTVQTNAIPTGLTGTASDFVLVTVNIQMPHKQMASLSQLFTRATIFR